MSGRLVAHMRVYVCLLSGHMSCDLARAAQCVVSGNGWSLGATGHDNLCMLGGSVGWEVKTPTWWGCCLQRLKAAA